MKLDINYTLELLERSVTVYMLGAFLLCLRQSEYVLSKYCIDGNPPVQTTVTDSRLFLLATVKTRVSEEGMWSSVATHLCYHSFALCLEDTDQNQTLCISALASSAQIHQLLHQKYMLLE